MRLVRDILLGSSDHGIGRATPFRPSRSAFEHSSSTVWWCRHSTDTPTATAVCGSSDLTPRRGVRGSPRSFDNTRPSTNTRGRPARRSLADRCSPRPRCSARRARSVPAPSSSKGGSTSSSWTTSRPVRLGSGRCRMPPPPRLRSRAAGTLERTRTVPRSPPDARGVPGRLRRARDDAAAAEHLPYRARGRCRGVRSPGSCGGDRTRLPALTRQAPSARAAEERASTRAAQCTRPPSSIRPSRGGASPSSATRRGGRRPPSPIRQRGPR